MSATRLLVLGIVRSRQPVHGYEVRRELLSWHLGESANVQPGSIYSALKTLEKAASSLARREIRPDQNGGCTR